MHYQRDQEKHQENNKQQLGDAGRRNGYSGKTQHSSDQRHYQEH